MRYKHPTCALSLGLLSICSMAVQPALADRPPAGYARPPIHVKPNATTSPTGLTPTQIKAFYGFDKVTNQGAGQTIAIVDAYDDPNIEPDLAVFSSKFGLPACTTANGCFKKVFPSGRKPRADSGWSLEIALDVEWLHAIAPAAKVMLVEAASNSFTDLLQGVDYAVNNGASVVSMSFGGNEFSGQTNYDFHFSHPNVTFVASSGDSGNGVEYPAASPYVIAVGGTTVQLGPTGYGSETAWSGSGGGISTIESQPADQYTFGVKTNNKRGVPDVAYDGDPNSGFPVYDTVKYQGQAGWFQVGGTSAGAPQWAGLFAIANSMRVAGGKLPLSGAQPVLYDPNSYGTDFYDISKGSNGNCGSICTAGTGYDFVTGLGSPAADKLVPALVAY